MNEVAAMVETTDLNLLEGVHEGLSFDVQPLTLEQMMMVGGGQGIVNTI